MSSYFLSSVRLVLLPMILLLEFPRDFCLNEVDLYNSYNEADNMGYIHLDQHMKNETGNLGGKIRFHCDINGAPMPRFRWLKGTKTLPHKIKNKLKIKQTVWGSMLKVDNLEYKDSGWYSCIASNVHGSRNTTAYLSVTSIKNRRPVNNEDKIKRLDSSTKGFCQNFHSHVCRKYLQGRSLFVPNAQYQSAKDREIMPFMVASKDYAEGFSDPQCLDIIFESLCLYHFPLCMLSSVLSRPVPKHLCKLHCQKVKTGKCKPDYDKLEMKLKSQFPEMMMNCDLLPPEAASCVGINSTDSQTNLYTQSTANECYNGTGENYAGQITISASGKPCAFWRHVEGFAHSVDQNFCRNPNPQEWGMNKPWCFTAVDVQMGEKIWTKEECSVQFCDDPNPIVINKDSYTDLLPVFISLGILGSMSLIFLFVCVFSRRIHSNGYAGILDFGKGNVTNAFTVGGSESLWLPAGSSQPTPRNLKSKMSDHSSISRINTHSDTVQMSSSEQQDLLMSTLNFGEEWGQSELGIVYRGEVRSLYGFTNSTPVGVKTIAPPVSILQQTDFHKEVTLLRQITHPNITPLIGVSTGNHVTPGWCMIFELPSPLNLHEYLTQLRLTSTSPTTHANSHAKPDPNVFSCSHAGSYSSMLTFYEQLQIAHDIASGLEYLSSQSFIHSDVACRNVLINPQTRHCKIINFGLIQCRYEHSDYYTTFQPTYSKIPLRWMAPEAIMFSTFSIESDMWSYGIVLWELWNQGLQPYHGYADADVIELVRSRQLLACPDTCPQKIYALMVECWNELPQHRPLIRDVCTRLRTFQNDTNSQPFSVSYTKSNGILCNPTSLGMINMTGSVHTNLPLQSAVNPPALSTAADIKSSPEIYSVPRADDSLTTTPSYSVTESSFSEEGLGHTNRRESHHKTAVPKNNLMSRVNAPRLVGNPSAMDQPLPGYNTVMENRRVFLPQCEKVTRTTHII